MEGSISSHSVPEIRRVPCLCSEPEPVATQGEHVPDAGWHGRLGDLGPALCLPAEGSSSLCPARAEKDLGSHLGLEPLGDSYSCLSCPWNSPCCPVAPQCSAFAVCPEPRSPPSAGLSHGACFAAWLLRMGDGAQG